MTGRNLLKVADERVKDAGNVFRNEWEWEKKKERDPEEKAEEALSRDLWCDESHGPAGRLQPPKYLASTWFSADVPDLAILGWNITRPDLPPQRSSGRARLFLCQTLVHLWQQIVFENQIIRASDGTYVTCGLICWSSAFEFKIWTQIKTEVEIFCWQNLENMQINKHQRENKGIYEKTGTTSGS